MQDTTNLGRPPEDYPGCPSADNLGHPPASTSGTGGERFALLLLLLVLILPATMTMMLREPLREQDPAMQTLWARTQEHGGWDPGFLTIPANTSVRLRLVALDVVHGFRIENPNGSLHYPLFDSGPIVSGEPPLRVTLPPLPPGEYTFSCSVACSQMHTSQTGRLVVVDR